MALTLTVVAFAMAGLIFQLARRGTPIHRAFATEAAAVDGSLVDVISNMQVVRAFGANLREQRRLDTQLEIEMGTRRRSMLYLEKLRLLHAGLTALITAGLLGWTILLWQAGRASIGDVVLISSLGFTILHGTRDLAVALVDLTQYIARLAEALESLLVAHEMPDAPDATTLLTRALDHPSPDAGTAGISFEHVQFSYPGRANILPDLNLNIPAGQRVGLVGASGAGKSTIMSLLQRFDDPDSGVVRIDGQDIAHVTSESLRAALAIVPQDIALFNRSVLDNIAYARPDATRAEIVRAADLALCRDFIEALPEGFDTMVGNRGTRLSGGQRQRLAIARALLKDAPILLLDEATSALDSESEHLIQQALERLMVGRTVIAIAHRLSTLRSFDRIIVLDHGRIIDDGPPDLLSNRPGPYRQLLRTQSMPMENTAPLEKAA
jgi:ATP-binding cassette subfamily B protein